MATKDLGRVTRKQDKTPSTKYKFWLPGVQAVASGDVVDRSGNINDFTLGGGTIADSDVWANPGYFSSIAGVDNGVISGLGIAPFDLVAGDSIILAFWINAALPASSAVHIGEAANSANNGILITPRTDGKMSISIADGLANTLVGIGNSIFIDSSDHHFVFALDGATKTAYLWNDAVIVAWQSPSDLTTITGDTKNTTKQWNFGSNKLTGTSIAMQFRDAHHLVFPAQGLPTNMTDIVNKLKSSPFYPLQDSDFT